MRRRVLSFACLLATLVAVASSCRRRLEVPDATYRETVTAFYTALAAMQTSQEVLARREFERVTQLVPGEPAGWANLGLLLMRQQDMDAAASNLAKAAELAPQSAAVQGCWRFSRAARAAAGGDTASARGELDPSDLVRHTRASTSSAGGTDGAAEAKRTFGLPRGRRTSPRLEPARLAAKSGDGAACGRSSPTIRGPRSWPAPNMNGLGARRPWPTSAAATQVAFLKNVLLRA
jgi:hypothetical protein